MVPDDGPASSAPELIPLQSAACRLRQFLPSCGIVLIQIEEMTRVQLVIAQEFESCAVKVVGAGFGENVNDGTGEPAVLGVKGVGNQPEFLNRIESRHNGSAVVPALLDIAPIDQERVCRLSLPIDGDISGVAGAGHRPVRELDV